MDKRIMALVTAALLSGQVNAFPIEAVGAFFSKLFKGGTVAKEAAVAGKAAEGAAAAKALDHLPVGDAALKATPVLPVIEPKPNMMSEPTAIMFKDANTYKTLRAAAAQGDPNAMLKMSAMTSSGKVSDPGEPWHGYWMFQAARLGNQEAAKNSHLECSTREDRRMTDRWFDFACGQSDNRRAYIGDHLPGASSLGRIDSSPRPKQPVATP